MWRATAGVVLGFAVALALPGVLGGPPLPPLRYAIHGLVVRYTPEGFLALVAHFDDEEFLSSATEPVVHWYFGEDLGTTEALPFQDADGDRVYTGAISTLGASVGATQGGAQLLFHLNATLWFQDSIQNPSPTPFGSAYLYARTDFTLTEGPAYLGYGYIFVQGQRG